MSVVGLKPKQVLFMELAILFIVTCFASIGLFLRTNLFAYDSYAFLSYVNGFTGEFGFGHELFFALIKLMPNNLLFFDFVMFGALFCSLVALYYGLKVIYAKRVSMVALLVTLAASPILLFSFAQFQNELFGYPFIFLSFKTWEGEKKFTVTFTQKEWEARYNWIETAKYQLKQSDLPSKTVVFINDSLLGKFQNEIAIQLQPQFLAAQDTTKKKSK